MGLGPPGRQQVTPATWLWATSKTAASPGSMTPVNWTMGFIPSQGIHGQRWVVSYSVFHEQAEAVALER